MNCLFHVFRKDVVTYRIAIFQTKVCYSQHFISLLDLSRVNMLTDKQKEHHEQQNKKADKQLEAAKAKLEAAEARCAQLEAQLGAESAPVTTSEQELEAYRRAERTERIAKERAELVYHQVNGVLAEASLKVEGVASEIGGMADQVMSQLTQLQVAVANSKKALNEAASTMYAIRPNE